MDSPINSLIQSGTQKLRQLVLACAVLEREIRQFQNGGTEFKFFDFGLHRTPQNMVNALQTEIDQASKEGYDRVILGYGLCSNGVVGIIARDVPLVIPRVHDCITFFLGSVGSYTEESSRHPGTYYLTPGWIDKGQTPITKFESYAQSYGEETAKWVLHEEMKNYTRILFIDTGVCEIESYRDIARQNAEFLGISYQEVKGSPTFFKELLMGPLEKDFLIIEKGQSIQQEMFLDL